MGPAGNGHEFLRNEILIPVHEDVGAAGHPADTNLAPASKLFPVSGLTVTLGTMLPTVAGPYNISSRFGWRSLRPKRMNGLTVPPWFATRPMSPVSD